MYSFNLYLNLLIYLCTWSYLLLLLLLSWLFLTLTLIRHIDWYEIELVLCILLIWFFLRFCQHRIKHSNPIQSSPKRNGIEIKPNIQNYIQRLRLFQNKKNKRFWGNFKWRNSKTIYFYSISKQDRDSDHQTDILNNLKSWKMETKSKTNLSNVEQKELSKWRNDETIVIKPLVISKAMIMQHLLNENTYKKLDCCFDIET